MRLPDIQTRLRVIASDLRRGHQGDPVALARELEALAEAISRKPRATHAPPTSAPMTPEKAEEIRRIRERYPAMSQHDIGRLTGTNQGRVSEVLAGKRK